MAGRVVELSPNSTQSELAVLASGDRPELFRCHRSRPRGQTAGYPIQWEADVSGRTYRPVGRGCRGPVRAKPYSPGPARQGGFQVRRRRSGVVASLIVTVYLASQASTAAAFGTIDSGGQHREHERLTRAALACAGEARSDPRLFRSRRPWTSSRDTTANSAASEPRTATRSSIRPRIATTPISSRRLPRTRDVGHRRAPGLRGPSADPFRRGGGRCRGSARRRRPGHPGRGQLRHGLQGLRSQRGRPSAPLWRRSGGSCTARRTSTRTATGPTRRTRPVRSAPTTRPV